jgi:RNA chaperone Hfq
MRHFVRAHSHASAIPTPPVVGPPSDPPLCTSDPPPVDGLSQADVNPVDILEDLREIRPEQKGGAAVAAHHESSRVGGASMRPGRQVVEDEFFQPLIEARTPVHVRCRDGYEIPRAVLREVGTYTLLVEADGATELVYKHAIISIRPAGARA